MAFFVDVVTEVEQLADLVSFLSKNTARSEEPDFKEWLTNATHKCDLADDTDLASLQSVLLSCIERSDDVIDQASDDDGFVYWSLLLGLCDKLMRRNGTSTSSDGSLESTQRSIVSRILAAVAVDGNGSETKAALRLKVLGTAYNYFPYAAVRCEILTAVLVYARKIGKTDSAVSKFGGLEEQLKRCGATRDQSRAAFAAASTILKERGSRDEIAFHLLRCYLATFDDVQEAAAADKATLDEAARSILLAIQLDSDVQTYHDLIDLKLVKRLENDADHNLEFELLKLFGSGNLSDYKSFVAKNAGVIDKLGLCDDDCVKKIRLLSLVSLAAKNHTLSYGEIAEKLDIVKDDVEDWIIDSIAADLLVAKMDQLNQVVVVQRCAHRVFEQEDWTRLENKLGVWAHNVEKLLTNVKATSAAATSAASVHMA